MIPEKLWHFADKHFALYYRHNHRSEYPSQEQCMRILFTALLEIQERVCTYHPNCTPLFLCLQTHPFYSKSTFRISYVNDKLFACTTLPNTIKLHIKHKARKRTRNDSRKLGKYVANPFFPWEHPFVCTNLLWSNAKVWVYVLLFYGQEDHLL